MTGLGSQSNTINSTGPLHTHETFSDVVSILSEALNEGVKGVLLSSYGQGRGGSEDISDLAKMPHGTEAS